MRCPVQNDRLGLGHPPLDLVATLYIEHLALAALDEKHWLPDLLTLRLSEVPRFMGGYFDAEVGVQIPYCLLQAPRNVSSHGSSLNWIAKERVHSGFPVTLPIALNGCSIQFTHGLPVRNGGQSSLQEDERVDAHRGISRELQGN